jgi:hypothetical protein
MQMAISVKNPEPFGDEAEAEGLLASEVRQMLYQLLESRPFRTSRQCKDLLRYIVERSLSGDDAALRERVIGTEVFGRKSDYDTNDDPVVRTRAGDVRKRLAQYYQSLEPGTCVLHFELQPGSYRIRFRHEPLVDASPTEIERPAHGPKSNSVPGLGPAAQSNSSEEVLPLSVPARSRLFHPRSLFFIFLLGVVLVVGVSIWLMESSHESPQQQFWAPLTTAKQPILVYLGANAAYIFSADFMARYRAAHNLPNNGPEFFVNLPPGGSVKTDDLVPVSNTFVTVADLSATVELTTLLRGWNRPFVLRSGDDLSMGDLRNRPSLMVGGFNNPWTLELNRGLPFSFQEGVRIENRDDPGHGWSVVNSSRGGDTDDYALITRLPVSKAGGPAITVAGISEFGTRAGAEFLASSESMRELLKTAPRGWQHMSMEVVLHVKVLDYQPVSVQVVATKYW